MNNLVETENKTKVLVNVCEPLVAILKQKLDASCLKRDAYLDKALSCESCYLQEEVTTPNSKRAENFITENLKQLRLKPLNLLLSKKTVELMNAVCKEKNIPRDTFINRIFLMLIATESLLEALFKGYDELWTSPSSEHDEYDDFIVGISGEEGRYFDRPNILDTVDKFVTASPFWWLRRSRFDGNLKLYTYSFAKEALSKLPDEFSILKCSNAIGFNTYMTDDEVSLNEANNSKPNNNKSATNEYIAAANNEANKLKEKKEKAFKKATGGNK